MEATIDSLLQFIDTEPDSIVTEGLKDVGKSVMQKIKNLWARICIWFKNLLRNINYFKNAQLDPQMNKDLVKVLNVVQARTELNFKLIPLFYSVAKMVKNTNTIDGGSFGVMSGNERSLRDTNIENEIDKCVTDLEESLNAAKKLEEYKRIMEDTYSNNNLQTIPLGNITSDVKKSESYLTRFNNELNSISITYEKMQAIPALKRVSSKMVVFLRKAIEYYTFRITLLTKYLNKAKLSLKGMVNNIKNRKNDEFTTKKRTKYSTPTMKKIMCTSGKQQQLKEIYITCRTTRDYNEYKKNYNELIRLTGVPANCNIESMQFNTLDNSVIIIYVKNHFVKIPVGGRKLYHQSHHTNITELTPRWKTGNGVLFPEPRVYAHLNIALDRHGNMIGRNDSNTYVGYQHVYELQDHIDYVYLDPEMGRTATYIVSDRPIRVKEISRDKFDINKKDQNEPDLSVRKVLYR